MPVDALEHDLPAVEKQAVVRPDFERAKTEALLEFVQRPLALRNVKSTEYKFGVSAVHSAGASSLPVTIAVSPSIARRIERRAEALPL